MKSGIGDSVTRVLAFSFCPVGSGGSPTASLSTLTCLLYRDFGIWTPLMSILVHFQDCYNLFKCLSAVLMLPK